MTNEKIRTQQQKSGTSDPHNSSHRIDPEDRPMRFCSMCLQLPQSTNIASAGEHFLFKYAGHMMRAEGNRWAKIIYLEIFRQKKDKEETTVQMEK